MRRHLSVGVIGHVDHGKTSLVKALTGIDTDRLREEKERGMSIVLGFAYLESDDADIDLIDVPGHESFVRTMIAGASGIDAALLVVDVNEGVMPQTVEHLAIAELIGVRTGLIALTKCELADGAQRTEAVRRLRVFLRGRCLESAPVMFTSVRSGEGLEDLQRELQRLPGRHLRKTFAEAAFHLPVDRVFSVAGRGTVVTGTLRGGCLRAGDELEIMPRGARAVVRQIEFHKRPVDHAWGGQRVGVNLRHVDADEIARGDTLAPVGFLCASALLDAHVRMLPGDGVLADGQTVRLLFGTMDVAARVRLLGVRPGERLAAGEEGIVQLHTQCEVAAVSGEPFVLRRESPPMTIGGGRFLDTLATRHRRSDRHAVEGLRRLAHGSPDDVLAERLKAAGYAGVHPGVLAASLGRTEEALMAALGDSPFAAVRDGLVYHRPFLSALDDMLCAAVDKFHRRYPMRRGIPLAQCRACMPATVGEGLFRSVLAGLCAARQLAVHDGLVCRYGFDPFLLLCEQDQQTARAIEADFQRGGVLPPDIDQVIGSDDKREALFYLLVERGALVLLPAGQPGRKLAFHRDAVDDACRRMHGGFPAPAQFTVSEARALLGSTRKFTVPLLEYLDAAGYTRRRGDKRTLLRQE